jgi:sialate O-acetylesterase
MVLQRGRPVPVWGWARPGESVSVRFAGMEQVARAAEDGRFQVELAPLEVSVEPRSLSVTSDSERLVLEDVLVGEVWLCSGQSNMAMPLSEASGAEAAIAAAQHAGLRCFRVARRGAAAPLDDPGGEWQATTAANAADLSALAYFFGRELAAEIGCPIGLVVCAWGASRIEAWTPLAALPDVEDVAPLAEQRAADLAAGRMPARQMLGALYDGMVAPLVPFAVRGVIWYQGESNVERARLYRLLFPALIDGWRAAWKHELVFLFVQIAGYRAHPVEPEESPWAELREAQAAALALPATGMVVAHDVGDVDLVHPPDKLTLARRLAGLALALAYGRDVACQSARFAGLDPVPGGALRVRLAPCYGGLATSDGAAPRGFAVAGADRRFVWATATLEGESVRVHHPAVPEPVAVRYAWAENPDANLVNAAGLPVASFRSDDWPTTEEQELPSPSEARRRARAERRDR